MTGYIDMNDPSTWPKPVGGASYQNTSYAAEAAERAEQVAEKRAEAPLPSGREKSAKTITVSGRMAMLLDGRLSVDDLDDEELQRGQVRSDAGNFSGKPSVLVPRELHDAMMRRILKRGAEKWREDYFDAIDTVTSIMNDASNDPNVRLKAAGIVLERVAGKAVEKVELSVEVKPWEEAMVGISKAIPAHLLEELEKQDPNVVDAEVMD